ncbi:MAG: CvpA family protein [Bacteroidota bacterium]
MILDLFFVVILVLAIFKGYRRGLIVGLFSFVAIIVGLAAAIKLSTLAADYIGKAVNVSDRWLPIISFAVVFIIVILLVRLGANAIQRTVEIAMLGWGKQAWGHYPLCRLVHYGIQRSYFLCRTGTSYKTTNHR